MAEFIKVMKDYKQMCTSFRTSCNGCLIYANKDQLKSCKSWIMDNPEDAEYIVAMWTEKHPIMTNRLKFREVFGLDILDVALISEINETFAEWLNREYREDANGKN